ncbi:hypothetical protein [Methylobacterium nigriterrae]|uniref:hypothetical protein n=1 Tax=Methylobacterium nigriterrae TaxID=3127512 RepID=UPI0030132C71
MAASNRQNTELLFTLADATWRRAIADRFGEEAVETYRYRQAGRGEPGTALRRAYNMRERAYQFWLRARGLGDVRHAPRVTGQRER